MIFKKASLSLCLSALMATPVILNAATTAADFTVTASVNPVYGLFTGGSSVPVNALPAVNFGAVSFAAPITPITTNATIAINDTATLLSFKLTEIATGVPAPSGSQFVMTNSTNTAGIGFNVTYTACDGIQFPSGNITNGAIYSFTSANQDSTVDPGSGTYCSQYNVASPTGSTGFGQFSFSIPSGQNPTTANYTTPGSGFVLTVCTSSSCT